MAKVIRHRSVFTALALVCWIVVAALAIVQYDFFHPDTTAPNSTQSEVIPFNLLFKATKHAKKKRKISCLWASWLQVVYELGWRCFGSLFLATQVARLSGLWSAGEICGRPLEGLAQTFPPRQCILGTSCPPDFTSTATSRLMFSSAKKR